MVVLLLAGAACRAGDDNGDPPLAAPSVVATGGDTQTSTVPPPLAAAGAARDCEESVSGDLGPRWRRSTILVGPVGFVARSYRNAPRSDFAPLRRGRYRGHKVLLLVRRGTTVTLMLLPHVRAPRASLLYDPRKWSSSNTYRVADGSRSMTFRACDGEFGVLPHDYTQFNGAFVVARPGCVPVDFTVAGESRHYRANISFGAGDCA